MIPHYPRKIQPISSLIGVDGTEMEENVCFVNLNDDCISEFLLNLRILFMLLKLSLNYVTEPVTKFSFTTHAYAICIINENVFKSFSENLIKIPFLFMN